MISILMDIIGVALGIAILLFFVNYWWYLGYLNRMLYVVKLVGGVILGLVTVAILVLEKIPKTAAFLIYVPVVLTLYLATAPALIVGGKAQRLNHWIRQHLPTTEAASFSSKVRNPLIRIAADHDDQELEYDTVGKYREEISTIPEVTKTRLSIGEVILSLSVAGGLILAQLFNLPVKSIEINGVPIGFLVQVYLLLLAVSILYRTSILDILAFDGSEELDSHREWDMAISYQRAVSFTSIGSVLMLFLIAATALTKARFSTAVTVLREQREQDLSKLATVKQIWKELRKNREEDN